METNEQTMQSSNATESTNVSSEFLTRGEFLSCFREMIETLKQPHTPLASNAVSNTNTPESHQTIRLPSAPFQPELEAIGRQEARSRERMAGSSWATRFDEPHDVPPRQMPQNCNNSSNVVFRGPQIKMPEYDGTDDIDVFIMPFERMASRYQWDDSEMVDRLFQCLKGPAIKFLSGLPSDVLNNYPLIKLRLLRRFGKLEPPSTVRRQLVDIAQRNHQSNEEFAEEVNRLVTRAYPGMPVEMADQLAAEHFLRGYKSKQIAYDVINRSPKSINEALSQINAIEHNYKAIMGKEVERKDRSTRRVHWSNTDESYAENEDHVNRVRQGVEPTYVTINQLDQRLKKIEAAIERIDSRYNKSDRQSRPTNNTDRQNFSRSPSPITLECFNCGKEGHFARKCPNRPRSKSPDATRTSNKSIKVTQFEKGKRGITVPIKLNNFETIGIVDTGADGTVISYEVAEKAGLQYKSGNRCKLLNAESEAEMTAYGGVTATLHIAGRSWDWPVYVAPIRDPVLLGIDFLQGTDAKILARQGDLVFGEKIVIGKMQSKEMPIEVVALEDEIIPPEAEVLVLGRISEVDPEQDVVLDPSSLKSGLQVGSVLVKANESIPIRILNLDKKEKKLRRGTHLGKLSPIETTSIEKEQQQEKEYKEEDIPSHLRDLYDAIEIKLNEDERQNVINLLCKFKDVFAKDDLDLGCFKSVSHRINTRETTPVRQSARRTPVGFQNEEKQHLDKMVDSGVVVPSQSEWASPVVLVRKKDGGVRWCVDYRKLNEVTIKDAYPLPNIEDCLDTLSGSRFFSTLDLMSGYYQVEMDPKDQHKTAFSTRYGLYEYTRMPFGLCNAPSTFQRAMEFVLRGLQWEIVLIYLDDIIVTGTSVLDHLKNLQDVLQRLEDHGLKLKPQKCKFFQTKVSFLGHVVGEEGVATNPNLVKDVQEWPVPKTRKELQSFLGLTNYYRKFIPNYAVIATPLQHLLKKDIAFEWGEIHDRAFCQLKEKLTSAPILAYPSDGTFILDTDASDCSIGAVLSQESDGVEKVVAYASKTLSSTQKRYCVTRKELLAIVVFTNQFRHYLMGKHFIIRTDHGSLAWLFRFKQPNGQLARWLEELSQYDFAIQHRSGKSHGNADALSRKYAACNCYDAGSQTKDLPCKGCKHCQRAHDNWERLEDVDYVVPIAVRGIHCNSENEQDDKDSWLPEYTNDELIAAQEQDNDLCMIRKWIKSGVKPQSNEIRTESAAIRSYWLTYKQFLFVEDVLYYRWESENGPPHYKLVVPKVLRREVLEYCHIASWSGHQGIQRTIARVKQSYHWYGLDGDVQVFVNACDICARMKKDGKSPRAPLQSYTCGSPLDRIHLDVLGPLPESKQGNKYILVIIDQFSKWVEAYALPHQGSALIADRLVKKFIATFGIPLEIHTDQGSNFQSALLKEIYRLLGITRTRTTPYHPSSNGQVERFNRTLLQMIRCYLQNQNEWDEHLELLLAAYRSTPHPATGFTPNRIMLGREVRQPHEVIFGNTKPQKGYSEPTSYVEHIEASIQQTQEAARKFLKRAQQNQKRLYDMNVLRKHYQVGDLVYILNDAKSKGKSPKLQSVREGPYVVSKVLGPVLYEVKNNKKTKVLHHDKLRAYQSECIPKWVCRMRNDMVVQQRGEDRNDQEGVPADGIHVNGSIDVDPRPCEDGTSGADMSSQRTILLHEPHSQGDLLDVDSTSTTTASRTRSGRRVKPPNKLSL